MVVVGLDISAAADDIEVVRRRLLDTASVRRELSGLLDEAARVGEQSAELYAPADTRGLRGAIDRERARLQSDGAIEASVGVGQVRGSEYPYFVHEGTGLYGKFRRKITPKLKRAMMFPWQTGLWWASTEGQPAQPYMTEAFEDIDRYVEQRIDSLVERIVG